MIEHFISPPKEVKDASSARYQQLRHSHNPRSQINQIDSLDKFANEYKPQSLQKFPQILDVPTLSGKLPVGTSSIPHNVKEKMITLSRKQSPIFNSAAISPKGASNQLNANENFSSSVILSHKINTSSSDNRLLNEATPLKVSSHSSQPRLPRRNESVIENGGSTKKRVFQGDTRLPIDLRDEVLRLPPPGITSLVKNPIAQASVSQNRTADKTNSYSNLLYQAMSKKSESFVKKVQSINIITNQAEDAYIMDRKPKKDPTADVGNFHLYERKIPNPALGVDSTLPGVMSPKKLSLASSAKLNEGQKIETSRAKGIYAGMVNYYGESVDIDKKNAIVHKKDDPQYLSLIHI
eukprot:TRINITY_DN4620_c0_g1_i8.p1 TRINITY_DN4620_c0_g1~~TRINITY_DN4620_c0_g1_i8.p1  ORF type:complete len:351 (-),score=28.95 TRINITY_DN4620_c0_g1_i8:60-1112(-)